MRFAKTLTLAGAALCTACFGQRPGFAENIPQSPWIAIDRPDWVGPGAVDAAPEPSHRDPASAVTDRPRCVLVYLSPDPIRLDPAPPTGDAPGPFKDDLFCNSGVSKLGLLSGGHADTPDGLPVVPPEAFSPDVPAHNPDVVDDNLVERPIYACACGCGIFEVGTATMLPQGAGGMLYTEYDYQNQNINWSGVKPAPGSANSDKAIRTDFITLGLEYFFNRSWGIQVELPYDNRYFKTTGGPSGSDIVSTEWSDFGDARLQALYAGFFEDQSLGVSFGAKVPTGSWTHEDRYHDIDRDTELGAGSLSLLGGAFYRHQITDTITAFTQVALDAPVTQAAGYRPGVEADGALGAYVTGFSIRGVKITPVGQVLISERGHDSGPHSAHPLASGYQRVLLSPGLEFDVHPFTFYADVEVPVYQHVSGEQVTAPLLFKFIMTFHF